MVFIKLADNAPSGRDIELPKSVKHRSIQGNTLILVPGASCELTDEEWAHVKGEHKDLVNWIRVIVHKVIKRKPAPPKK